MEITMDQITVPAKIEQLDRVQEFVAEHLECHDCSMKVMMQIEIAVEEIFVNIANYAYQPASGEVKIGCEVRPEPLTVMIRFADRGRPFDPLAKEDADTSKDALIEREGGLGILMVKKSMDEVGYAYENGCNVLTITKKLKE